jgi:hypothetical protein
MGHLAPVLGVLAGLAGIADTIPYVRDTVRGSTRPHRGSWLIWGVPAIVACVAQLADGASWGALMTGTQAIVTGAVFLQAIRYGEGGMSATDLSLIALAGGGLIGWVVASEPIVAVGCVIAADLIGVAMMTPKVHRDPHSETLSTYALASIGGALATGAVGMLDLSLIAYPAYYCLANAALAILIYRRRAALRKFPARQLGLVSSIPNAPRLGADKGAHSIRKYL